jgi:hypothetical protein
VPICYRPNDLGRLLNLARWRPGQHGEQVLHWHRPLIETERAAVVGYFLELDCFVEWTNCDELTVKAKLSSHRDACRGSRTKPGRQDEWPSIPSHSIGAERGTISDRGGCVPNAKR